MDADSLTNKFWEGIQTLSLADTIDYIDDPNLLLQPEGKVVCIRNNTGPHDLKALEALLRLHRYSFLHSPTDIVQSYRIALSSLSLADEPGHACLFFLLSSHSWDLFERTKQLQHLTNAIDLLSDLLHFLGVEQLGPHMYSVVSVVFACICMQFCLKEGEKEARETAIEALKDARREASRLKWVSSTRTRTVVVIADIMRYRYEEFGPQGDFNAASVDILMSILDTIPTSGDSKFQFTALEILTTSLIFQLSKERDASTWYNDLCALHSLTSLAFSTVISPIIEPPPKETLEKLTTSLRQCKIASYTRPLCLIFTADHLDSHEEPPEVDVTAQSSQIGFAEECEKAREHFLKLLNFLKSAPDAQAPQKAFQIFRVIGRPEHRVSQARVRFLQIEADEGHICMFNFTIVPADISEDEAGGHQLLGILLRA
ncbi:hypothetical protein CVT26_015983 [Gymnopilus dilepis]|uniref:Uncharacterized protein n=1 Tax=Gymnopilus dilepis TaxID=231916 RepID=A0A409XYR2_9AGAR|nr:hypothetical protein CVT26_015983 [Gymnopilus dilepis]